MKTSIRHLEQGNGLVVTVSVIMTVLTILGAAVSYTGHVSRVAQRSRRTALAMEIADGHLEYLFSNWRNIYRKTWTTYNTNSGGTDYSIVGTNYFYTASYNPSNGCSGCAVPTPVPNMTPSATPPQIPLPSTSYFPTEPNYTVSQYRIQAVDPMIDLCGDNAVQENSKGNNTSKSTCDTSNFSPIPASSAPPGAYGPNCMSLFGTTYCFPYSFYYLAAVDVSVPAIGTNSGTVTAKVRRVFEKKFDMPWRYAMFFVDDLEFQPTSSLTITGPIQTNASLYIGTSNFTSTTTVGYGGDYVNGYSPNDSTHSGSASAPNFATNMPPAQMSPYLPFGWSVDLNASDTNPNNDSYHDIIETPNSSYSDGLSNVRMYNQADYKVMIDSSNNITITDYNGNSIVGNGNTKNAYNAIVGAITTNQAIQDNREGTYVRLATVDVGAITTAVNNGTLTVSNNGNTGLVLYIKDTTTNGTSISSKIGGTGTTVNTTERAIRLKNGAVLPSSGLTIASENPVYIQGDYNTGTGTVPSNNGTFTDPDASGYTRKNSAVYGDAINILSNAWVDTNSTLSIPNRIATNTTVNTALVTGEVASGNGKYSGGGEGFVRFLEDWQKNSNTFTYYGS
ncbi:MAG TPA: hypothetical protein VFA58_01745, partial [Chthoniobacterales bacterium]|nr:hypothetical protein [Chthoniobacterales bacterium]